MSTSAAERGRLVWRIIGPFARSSAYGGCNLNEGVFFLFVKGNNKAIMSEPCSASNFFPGFYLLLMMTAPGEQ